MLSVVHDSVALDLRRCVTQDIDSMPFVLLDLVRLDRTFRVEKDDSIFLILFNNVRRNYEVKTSLHNEYSLLLTLLDVIVLNLGRA